MQVPEVADFIIYGSYSYCYMSSNIWALLQKSKLLNESQITQCQYSNLAYFKLCIILFLHTPSTHHCCWLPGKVMPSVSQSSWEKKADITITLDQVHNCLMEAIKGGHEWVCMHAIIKHSHKRYACEGVTVTREWTYNVCRNMHEKQYTVMAYHKYTSEGI